MENVDEENNLMMNAGENKKQTYQGIGVRDILLSENGTEGEVRECTFGLMSRHFSFLRCQFLSPVQFVFVDSSLKRF